MKQFTKKIIILSLIPNFLICTNISAKSTNKRSYINISKTDSEQEDNSPDFRKIRWGMSIQQVSETEKSSPESQNSNFIVYKDKLMELDTNVTYFFEKGKLIKASYLSEPSSNNPEDYIVNFLKIKKTMTEKYGIPFSDSSSDINFVSKEMYRQIGEVVERGGQSFDVKWETPRTKIKMTMVKPGIFSKMKLEIEYASKSLINLDEQNEAQKSKF
jgi:hypothetical protein